MEQTNTRRPSRGQKPRPRNLPNFDANEGRRAPARDPLPTGPFADMGIDHRINANVAAMGLTKPTPIQDEAIPAVVKGRDVLGLAQTGTGKTAAFGLPMLTRLINFGKKPDPKTCRALILAPTRELATQIATNIDAYAEGTPIRSFRVVGGASINVQTERLSRGVDVLIATPGRLMDLIERRAISLEATTYLVLDEADQMLDIGFIHTLRKIARMLPKDRQTLLFSATMPKLMEELADTYLTDPVRVAVNPPGQAAKKIEQGVHFVTQGDKATLLAEYLSKHPGELAMVFGRTKHGSESWPSCWRSGASRSPRSTATSRRASGNGRSTPSARGRRRCWWRPTSPPVAWISPRWRMSITTTCRTCRKIMSTGSGGPRARAATAAPWPSARLPRWANCAPSKRP